MAKTVLFLIDDVHLEGRPDQMHQDFAQKLMSKIQFCKSLGDKPVLICAGDIGEGVTGLEWVSQFDCDIVYVCGNHEFWSNDYYELIETLQQKTTEQKYAHIKFLHNSTCVIHGIRFIGATLWTDLACSWPWLRRNYVIKNFLSMADFRRITARKFYEDPKKVKSLLALLERHGVDPNKAQDFVTSQSFNPYLQIEENARSSLFIEKTLNTPFEGGTIVVSHHLPLAQGWMKKLGMNPKVLSASFINQELSQADPAKLMNNKDVLMMGFYVNQLDKLFESKYAPDVWVHGHFHQEINEFVGKTHVASAPVGYLKQSSEMVFKEIYVEHSKEDLIKFIRKEVENYQWIEKISTNLGDLQKSIIQLETAIGLGLMTAHDAGPIIRAFQGTHENNLQVLEQNMSNWLAALIKQKQSTMSKQPHNNYYITSNLSGFNDWMLRNTKARFPDRFQFMLDELSFISEEKYRSLGKGRISGHYKEWLKESQRIQIQIPQYKRAFLDFLEYLAKEVRDVQSS